MARLVTVVLVLIFSCSRITAQSNLLANDLSDTSLVRQFSVDSILTFAESFIGCKYGYGSCGPKSFDCSGFVSFVYAEFHIVLPHGSNTIAAVCDEIKLKKVEPGDLLFFSGRKVSKKNIGHVSIVKEVDGDRITMIHATVQSGVIQEDLAKSEYFSKRYIRAGRIPALAQILSQGGN